MVQLPSNRIPRSVLYIQKYPKFVFFQRSVSAIDDILPPDIVEAKHNELNIRPLIKCERE